MKKKKSNSIIVDTFKEAIIRAMQEHDGQPERDIEVTLPNEKDDKLNRLGDLVRAYKGKFFLSAIKETKAGHVLTFSPVRLQEDDGEAN